MPKPLTPASTTAPAATEHLGMGAIPYPGGVTFRVWSEFGDSVSVVGDFNDWNATATPMARDGETHYWSVDVADAKIGHAYKFYIPYAANANHVPERVDPYARLIQQGPDGFNAVVSGHNTPCHCTGYTTPNWKKAVLYELHVPTFSTKADGSHGTLLTAVEKLESLAEIGINAIEIMPLGQFEGITSAGYNPGYIFAVEDTWGGPEQFRQFVNEAHRLGIAVIVDVVYNHLGGTDVWQFDGWSQDGTCPFDGSPTNGGAYFFEDFRAHTDFSHARFDLGRPEVCQYIFDNALMWMNDRYVDGLRFDSVVNMRAVQVKGKIVADVPEGKSILQRINQSVQAFQGWKILIAEDLQNWGEITTPIDQGGFGFNAQWNDDLCWNLRTAATQPLDAHRDIGALANSIAKLSNGAAFQSVVYSENHDQDDPDNLDGGRLPSIIGNGEPSSWFAKKQSTLAAAVVLTIPGVPMLFEGQEFLESSPFSNYDGTPQAIDWSLATQFAGIRNLYRDLIRLRRDWFDNSAGLTGPNTHVLPVFGDNVLIYHRWDNGGEGDDVVVVCNFSTQSFSDYAVGFPRGGMWRVRFNSDATEYDSAFQGWHSLDTDANGPAINGMPFSGNIGLGPYSCVILSQG